MPLHFSFNNSYARLPERLYAKQDPISANEPKLLSYNRQLADELNVTGSADDDELAALFAGNSIPANATPIAQAYAGHQFGNFVPSLGDGRAVLLGEVVDKTGRRRDIQLKGSGRTPFSRGGDGRAWLGPVLREYVVSEAMHALGIPTTRALAAVTTGEDIYRQEGAVPGAVLTRVAASHLRVGTFQYFAARGDREAVQVLFDYAVQRHFPDASTPLELLNHVIRRQAELVAKWMGVGFIHGVMNTDNTSISGETIDYGPCAFMDRYHPVTVYSSIDRFGRYAYDKQQEIIVWNIAQLAGSLLFLEDNEDTAVEAFTKAVHAMPEQVALERLRIFRAKLGIEHGHPEDAGLIDELLTILVDHGEDFTNTFRWLATGEKLHEPRAASAFDDWRNRWMKRLDTQDNPQSLMQSVNPALIPRNHRIEEMIQAAVNGDMHPFERLMEALAQPFGSNPDYADLTLPPEPHEEVQATFCGT